MLRVLSAFPVGLFGVLLLFAGVELAIVARDMSSKAEAFVSSSAALGFLCDYRCYPLSSDEDDMSSTHSALRYCSAGSDEEEEEEHPQRPSSSKIKVTRFGPEESSSPTRADQPQPLPYRTVLQHQCRMSPEAGRPRHRGDDQGRGRRRMARNRSMVDMRSQLLHRTLVEELNKRLFFNTVGAVENIGFRRVPCYGDDHRRRTKDKHHYMF